jgi:hypothetical protein
MVFTINSKTKRQDIPKDLQCVKIDIECINFFEDIKDVDEIHFINGDIHITKNECICRNCEDFTIFKILKFFGNRIEKLILQKCHFSSKIFKTKNVYFTKITFLIIIESYSTIHLSCFLSKVSINVKHLKVDSCEKKIFSCYTKVCFPNLKTITDLNKNLKPYYKLMSELDEINYQKFPQLINYYTKFDNKLCYYMFRNDILYEENNKALLQLLLHNRSKINAIITFYLCINKHRLLCKDVLKIIVAKILNFSSRAWEPQPNYKKNDIIFTYENLYKTSVFGKVAKLKSLEIIMDHKQKQIKKRKKLESDVQILQKKIEKNRKKIKTILF